MRRPFWFAAGAGAGVYAMVRGRRAAEALTLDGLRDRWSGLALGARLVREEVARGSAEKETELRERYGLVPHGAHELTGGRHRAVVAAEPTTDRTDSTTDSEGSS
jgi:Family of unknown function (DUF6167)